MSGRIPQNFIDELLVRIDIVDIIGARLSLRKAGREFVANCPFHNEKTPSFSVSQEKQFYYCFGCGAHGSAISFLMEHDHLDFVEAIHELASFIGMEVPVEAGAASTAAKPNNKDLYELLERAVKFYSRQLKIHPKASQAVDYLKSRGLTGEIAARFGIGFAPPGWDNVLRSFINEAGVNDRLLQAGLAIQKDTGGFYDRFRNRIMFPIHDYRGRVIGFGGRVIDNDTPKYLNSPETSLFEKGRELYGLYHARERNRDLNRLLVVEGYMDVVGLAQFGIENAVATLGTATTRHHLERLFRIVKEVVFCFDGDRAGREAAWRALETALPMMNEGRQVNFMFLPDGEDPDSLVRKEGKHEFESRIVNSIPFSKFFFENLSKQADLSNIDGRSRLAEMARPLIQKIPQGIFREMMISRLAEITRINEAKLARLIEGGNAFKPAVNAKTFAALNPSRPSLVRWVIRLLMYRADLAQHVGDLGLLKNLQLPGMYLMLQLIELLQANPNYNLGVLLEHWRGTEEGRYLEKLAQWQPPMPDDGIETEFKHAIQRLTKLCGEQRKQQLLGKSIADLSPEEKRELQQLFNV